MAVKMSQDGNELELGLIPNKSVAQSLSFTNTNHFLKNSSRDHLHELLDDTTGKKEQAYERVESKTGECSQHSPFLIENLHIKEKHYISTKTVMEKTYYSSVYKVISPWNLVLFARSFPRSYVRVSQISILQVNPFCVCSWLSSAGCSIWSIVRTVQG